PLVQQDSPTRTVLDVTQSFNVIFSSDRSSDRFTGKAVSQTTGLYYYYQRWYDPSIGRFISQDPLAGEGNDPQSVSPYAYATNTPTSLKDPSGLFATQGCQDYCGAWLTKAFSSIAAYFVLGSADVHFHLDSASLGELDTVCFDCEGAQ